MGVSVRGTQIPSATDQAPQGPLSLYALCCCEIAVNKSYLREEMLYLRYRTQFIIK